MNSLSVKVYILDDTNGAEIRRFSMEEELCTSFEYLDAKIRSAVPELLRKDFKIMWQDKEGEHVTVSSDEELKIAVHSLKSGADSFKIYVKVNVLPGLGTSDHIDHPGVTCDGCNRSLKGFRYKCMTCDDYDLCSLCHQKGVHSEHDMMCIRRPTGGNSQVFSFPSMRGCHRARPFCRGGRGPMGWCSQRSFASPHCGKRDDCAPPDQASTKNVCEDIVKNISAAFGLDPDVAMATSKSMIEDLFNQFTDDCPPKQPDVNGMHDHNECQDQSSTSHVGTPSTNVQQKDLSNEKASAECESMDTLKPHDDFVLVDGSTQGAANQISAETVSPHTDKQDAAAVDSQALDNLTDEQLFQKRLDTAIKQMEAMGFKNDGGWLMQLLVAKQLNISAVLDAMNPQ